MSVLHSFTNSPVKKRWENLYSHHKLDPYMEQLDGYTKLVENDST